MSEAIEKFVLTQSIHLGFVRESFGAGAVIEYHPEKRITVIDGRKFEDFRDIELLKRQAAKFPNNPLVVPYSAEAVAQYKKAPAIRVAAKPLSESMQVIQSDEDLSRVIDVSDTQVSRIANEAKEAARIKTASGKLEVINGDESADQRLARLQEESRKNALPIVQDDGSLGVEGGSRGVALNAGQVKIVKPATNEELVRIQEARKREAEAKRAKILAEQEVALLDAESTPSPIKPVVANADIERRVGVLETQVQQLTTLLQSLTEVVKKNNDSDESLLGTVETISAKLNELTNTIASLKERVDAIGVQSASVAVTASAVIDNGETTTATDATEESSGMLTEALQDLEATTAIPEATEATPEVTPEVTESTREPVVVKQRGRPAKGTKKGE